MSDNLAMSPEQLQAIDKQHIWHPYSQVAQDQSPALPIVDCAQGVYLKLASGEQVIDGMSSWWCMLHGYNHPVLNAAAKAQLDKMSHVMFGGLTHEPAIKLAKLLVDITPAGLDKVFFADSGSVSVEVAIKMALQYWYSLGRTEKQRLITIKNGYHGDTFGAMASCDPVNGMHHLFSANLPQHHFLEAPPMGFDKPPCPRYLQEIKDYIAKHHHEIAAFILEPVVQGAGGMRFYSPAYLQEIKTLCEEYDLLLIADEIATGFGRSGKLFACEHAGISPDILCLGKALSGGYMTLAATLCSEKIADGICHGEASVFMHGPTFMANPLACATALASTELLIQQDWQDRVNNIETQLNLGLAPLRDASSVADVRVLGAIGVVEMKQGVDKEALQSALIERGVWLRPFGKLVYTMPPFVSTNEELQQLCSAMVETLNQ